MTVCECHGSTNCGILEAPKSASGSVPQVHELVAELNPEYSKSKSGSIPRAK